MSGSVKGDEAFDGLLAKPFDEAMLLKTVAEALR